VRIFILDLNKRIVFFEKTYFQKKVIPLEVHEGLARHAVSSAEHLRNLARQFPEISGHLQKIREEEHAAEMMGILRVHQVAL
jgi:hypothetical protein